MKKLLLFAATALLLLVTTTGEAQGQSSNAQLQEIMQAAIAFEDVGKADAALVKLEEAKKIAPDNIDVNYEIAYSYHIKKDYKQTISILMGLVQRKDADDRIYEMLGNTYPQM